MGNEESRREESYKRNANAYEENVKLISINDK
jgi:hypothetical protein